MSLVFTQANLDDLKAALISGAMEVQIGDRRVKYRSQAELLAAIKMVQNYLDGVSTDVEDNPNVIVSSYSRSGQTSE